MKAEAQAAVLGETAGRTLVEKNWDPISRIVGNLGVYTKIDFENHEVAECKVTSSLFRGYSVFLRGKDPRDAHFITSRICGICGDNHCTCSLYAQNMAYGIKPPALTEWMINLGEAAEFMFDHTLFQDNLVFVDFCEQMVRETNPSLLDKAEKTPAPHADRHGFRTIADIMRAFNPFEGSMYKQALQLGRTTREMCCLMEGRHVHPSTLYPGGIGTVATPQVFSDYLVRLLRVLDFVKKAVPLNDDLFEFFYETLPGYENVGRRRTQLACWGTFMDPQTCDYRYETMNDWGHAAYVTPGMVVDDKLVTNNLVDINLGMRILLGTSYYKDWEQEETFVTHDPLGNPVDQRHPWNQTTIPHPQKRDFESGNYSWVMSPRWYNAKSGELLAMETGGGPLARLWSTALSALVKTPYVEATGKSIRISLPRSEQLPQTEFEWKVPLWCNTIERDRARIYFIAYSAAMALFFYEKAMEEVRAGHTKTFTDFQVPEEAIGVGFHEAVRGVLSHHLVIRDHKIANYHPYPPTCWNASSTDSHGVAGPMEEAVRNTPIFEENDSDNFKGIDILRTVRSFDPCLPCGVHMYTGGGRVLEAFHSPMLGLVGGKAT